MTALTLAANHDTAGAWVIGAIALYFAARCAEHCLGIWAADRATRTPATTRADFTPAKGREHIAAMQARNETEEWWG